MQAYELRISISKEEFIELLLLNGRIKITVIGGQEITIRGASNHQKYGPPGLEDGSNHFFTTYVTYDGQDTQAMAVVNSHDSGKTYQGVLSFNIYPDNLSE